MYHLPSLTSLPGGGAVDIACSRICVAPVLGSERRLLPEIAVGDVFFSLSRIAIC